MHNSYCCDDVYCATSLGVGAVILACDLSKMSKQQDRFYKMNPEPDVKMSDTGGTLDCQAKEQSDLMLLHLCAKFKG